MNIEGPTLTKTDWQIRPFIYRFFLDNERPPTTAETADSFGISEADARASFRRLGTTHAFVLQEDGESIRIAKPLSAIPTAYRVRINGHQYYANCAWDALGVPAMLHTDAVIEADIFDADEPVQISVQQGDVHSDGGVIHIPIPFRYWFEDMIHT